MSFNLFGMFQKITLSYTLIQTLVLENNLSKSNKKVYFSISNHNLQIINQTHPKAKLRELYV